MRTTFLNIAFTKVPTDLYRTPKHSPAYTTPVSANSIPHDHQVRPAVNQHRTNAGQTTTTNFFMTEILVSACVMTDLFHLPIPIT